MTTAGEINVKLGLNSDSFIKSMDDAERELQALEGKLKMSKKHFEAMSKAMAVTKNPTKEMTEAFKKLKVQLQQDQNAFNNFQKNLKGFDGGLIKSAGGVNLLQGAIGKLATGGAIVMLTKQLIDFSKESVAAFRVQERALKSLDTALQNSGIYTSEYAQHLRDLSSEIQSFSNYGDEAVEKAIALGQSYSGNIKLTDELIKAVVDYAAATETDLNTAFTLVGKSIGTSTNALARYGVELDQNMSKEEKAAVIAQTLGQRFTGAANNMADSSVQLKNATGDLSEAFGQALNPAVEKTEKRLLQGVQALTRWVNQVRIMSAEINNLSLEDLNKRAIENSERLARLASQKSRGSATAKALEKQYRDEQQQIIKQIKLLKEAEKVKAETSKTNYRVIKDENTTTTQTKQQDKALEAYKKYVEEYQKLTQNYEATLQARQYVEGTLNIDPVKQQQEYDQALKVYQSYFVKIQKINTSGAKNKAELLKLNEENLARELQEIRVNKELETQRKLNEIAEGYATQANQLAQANESNAGFLGGLFGEGYARRLELEQWYQNERQKIIQTSNDNIELQQEAFANLEILRTQKLTQESLNTWQQYGSDVSSILNQSFSDILSGNMSFSDAMKSLLSNLYQELIKMALKQAMEEIAIAQMKAAALMVLNTLTGGLLGAFSKAGGFISSGFSAITGGAGRSVATPAPLNADLPIYHSGGLVPGTKEQLAVLQGGERVLNRSESASYSSGETGAENGINNIMMFNIKAWDGKDVIQTLKANSQTINQIVNSGIKNNQQGLRSTVQNI